MASHCDLLLLHPSQMYSTAAATNNAPSMLRTAEIKEKRQPKLPIIKESRTGLTARLDKKLAK